MIQWVYERTRQAKGISAVYVATDDERVASAVQKFGGQVVMTSPEIQSGTDRVWAVAQEVSSEGSDFVFVNVQGDEPLIEAFGSGTITVPIS